MRKSSRVPVYLVAFLSVAMVGLTNAHAEKQSKADGKSQSVEMFAAIEARDIEVTVIPTDSKRVTIRIENKTDQPLSIRLPAAMAAGPVLAQFQPNNIFNNNNNLFNNNNNNRNNNRNNNQNSPQLLGVGNQNRNNQPMVFNVPAGKVVKQKLPAVCMEHGKPEPAARMPYELRPLSEVTDKTEMVSVLQALGAEQVSQRVAQVAAWHVCNDMEWESLAVLKIKHLNGQQSPQFSINEVKTAKALVDAIRKSTKKSQSQSQSQSQTRSQSQYRSQSRNQTQSQNQSQSQNQTQSQRAFAISR